MRYLWDGIPPCFFAAPNGFPSLVGALKSCASGKMGVLRQRKVFHIVPVDTSASCTRVVIRIGGGPLLGPDRLPRQPEVAV